MKKPVRLTTMKPLRELFEIVGGNKLDFNKMAILPRALGGVNFIGRSSQNQGLSGTVARLSGIAPFDDGLITVALGGMKPLSSFVQPYPFYTAQNVAVLKPRVAMNFSEKSYVGLCIRQNRFRYSSHGREANRTLKDLLIPDPTEFPEWVKTQGDDFSAAFTLPHSANSKLRFAPELWRLFAISDLFEIKKGKRLTKARMKPGKTPYIGAIAKNNGVAAYVDRPIHQGNTITVSYDGSIGEAFYQPEPYWCSDAVNVLYPKFQLTPAIALFLVTVIRKEKYRFNYGRKWHLERMAQSQIPLPAKPNGSPDWDAMSQVINSLPFSSQL